MNEGTLLARLSLYILLGLFGAYTVALWIWQARILRGHAFPNPDGSVDSWKEQRTHYGIAFADVFVQCPVAAAGILLTLVGSRWGHYLMAMTAFFYVWANVMTSATSIRFYHPRRNLVAWFLSYPLGILMGLAYLLWSIVHFDALFLR